MAVTSQQIIDFLVSNPGMSDAQIVAAMEQYGVSPAQMATAVGLDEGQVAARVASVIPPNETKLLGDTYVQAVNQTTGSGENLQVGGLENVITYKASDNKVGGDITYYTPEGEYQQTTKQQEVNATKDFLKFAAITGAGLFGLGALGAGGATAITATEAAGLGLTAAEAASLGLSATEFAAATGAAGATGLLTPAVTSAVAPTVAGTAASTLTPAVASATTIPAAAAATTAATALTPTAASVLAPAAVSALTPTVANIATSLIPTAVNKLLTPTNIGNLFQTGTQTAAGLLQQQTSKEAAQKAQAMIDAETAAAKQSAAFRPIGMTTRFGASQFGFDPKTGQLTSAGYTLSPEAKAAQDRFVKLAEQGIQQAEGAQAQFAPLQTGAQSLFGLGNKYLAQNPQEVAQNYLNQQMALLQPGRELELANLQNRLQQQGRGGLSVAQGGTLGATTPELQALFNARAQQEAQLAANAQREGQQNVLFGAGLLGQGSQAMGQYYGGQQAAYAPYTTALGQVQGLETAAQQPFTMGAGLGQTASTAGARAGQLGLEGARLSAGLATSADATRNPYSYALGGLAASPAFAGLFSNVPPVSAMSALPTSFGTGAYYGNQDLGLFL